MRHVRFGLVALAALFCGPLLPSGAALAGDTLEGRAAVIDGDTLKVRGIVVGLFGIAAPRLDQTCETRSGSVPCGRQVAKALADRIGGSAIICQTRELDRAHRRLAICRLGEEDLNAWLVSSGLAVSERFSDRTYFAHETQAWAKRRGLWAGVFEDPAGRSREDYALAAAPTTSDPDGNEDVPPGTAGMLKLGRLGR